MTEAEQGDRAAVQRARRRWLLVLMGTSVVGYGVGAVVWRLLSGNSWADAFWFAGWLAVTNVVGQWLTAVIRRRSNRADR